MDSTTSPSLLLQIRGGDFIEHGQYIANDQTNNQYTDQSLNTFIGSDGNNHSDHNRLQLNGSLSYYKSGWWGTHNFKFGGEVYHETDWSLTSHLNNIALTVNNGFPAKVTLYLPPTKSYNNIREFGFYAEDSWKTASRLTLNLGVRFDQYLPYAPTQPAPQGLSVTEFNRINGPLFNTVAPRLGAAYALTEDGKTLLKANFGQYYEDPFYSLAAQFNPNSATSTTYAWNPPSYTTTVIDGVTVPVFVPGTQGAALSTTGANQDGSQSVTVAPNCPATSSTNPCPTIPPLRDTYLLQATTYVERELARNFGIRTGFVFNTWRNPYGEVNIAEPYSGFTVPVTVRDPGPDGKLGTADDGATYTVYDFPLNSSGKEPSPRQVIENLPLSLAGGSYYNWEISATKRMVGRWSLMASFVKTWAYENPLVAWSGGNPSSSSSPFYTPNLFNPNTYINTTNGRNDYTNWTAKFTGTYKAWKGIQFLPTFRSQSGAPFARTFTENLNYGSAVVIKAEKWGAERLPTINIFDVRTEKDFTLKERWKMGLFFDVYNIFNANATQTATQTSGASFLRPTTITGPRMAAYGAKLDF